jgi:O-antigen ligase
MEPNSTARVFFTGLIVIPLIGDGCIIKGRLIKIVLFSACLAAGLLTGSRSFYIALVIFLFAILYVSSHKLKRLLTFTFTYGVLIVLFSGIVALFIAFSNVTPSASEIVADVSKKSRLFTGLDDGDRSRIYVSLKSPIIFFEHAFVGTGLDRSQYVFSRYTSTPSITVHNAVINFVIELGFFGLLLAVLFFTNLIKAINRSRRKEIIYLLCVITFDMFSTLQWTRMNWVPIVAFFTWSKYQYQSYYSAKYVGRSATQDESSSLEKHFQVPPTSIRPN